MNKEFIWIPMNQLVWDLKSYLRRKASNSNDYVYKCQIFAVLLSKIVNYCDLDDWIENAIGRTRYSKKGFAVIVLRYSEFAKILNLSIDDAKCYTDRLVDLLQNHVWSEKISDNRRVILWISKEKIKEIVSATYIVYPTVMFEFVPTIDLEQFGIDEDTRKQVDFGDVYDDSFIVNIKLAGLDVDKLRKNERMIG